MILKEKYNCEMKSTSKNVEVCPSDFIYLALNKMIVTKKEIKLLPCQIVTFEKMAHIDSDTQMVFNIPRLKVTVDETLEYYTYFNNFSIRTMVGEGGGAFGIFLGICLLDFIELVFRVSSTKTVKLINRWLTVIGALFVIGMASDVLTEYNNEVEVTSIGHSQAPGPIPRITLCPTSQYYLWLWQEQDFTTEWPMNISDVLEAVISYPQLLPTPLGEGLNFDPGIKVEGNDNANDFSTMIFSRQYGICYTL